MICHLVAIPQEKDLKILNKLRNHVYENNFRLKNKPLSSDTHITLAQVNIQEKEIENLEKTLQKNISKLKPFSLNERNWILTKEEQEPNYKKTQPYTWIALKFEQRKDIFEILEKITKELGIDNNAEYIKNVKRVGEQLKNSECIANHINLSNYTKREKGEECWKFFNEKLPNEIFFNKICLREDNGNLIFCIKL